MSIAKGRDWGEVGPIPGDAVFAATDCEAAAVVAAARRDGQPAPPVVLTGGDLARTLGAAGGRRPADGPSETTGGRIKASSGRARPTTGARVWADMGAALVDGRLFWFAAHLVARRSWWRGRVLVVANAAFMGKGNVAPRAHPGDGRLDVIDARLRLGDRIKARSRLGAGAHVPHPDIEQRRVTAAQFDLDPALNVYADGRPLGRAAAISVRVEPASLEVWLPLPAPG